MASRKIEDLHEIFQPMVRELLKQGQDAILSTGYTFFITDGFRSFDEQTTLYNQGRTTPGKIVTNAKAGQSAHNYGLAVDCAFQKNGSLSYDPSLYAPVYKIARTLGFELGADWTGFSDKPHFEHPEWEKISKGEIIMTETLDWKGLDPTNLASLNVAVLKWAEVRDGLYIEKSKYDELQNQLIQTKKDNEELDGKLIEARKALTTCEAKPPIYVTKEIPVEVKVEVPVEVIKEVITEKVVEKRVLPQEAFVQELLTETFRAIFAGRWK